MSWVVQVLCDIEMMAKSLDMKAQSYNLASEYGIENLPTVTSYLNPGP